MRFSNYLFILGWALFLGFVTTSCETVKNGGNANSKEFLATKDLALKSWLNKRISVDYQAVSPKNVFGQEPLKEIKIRVSNLPEDSPPFTFTSPGLSRRELLEKIAHYWDLEMIIHKNAAGNPTFITATGKVDAQ